MRVPIFTQKLLLLLSFLYLALYLFRTRDAEFVDARLWSKRAQEFQSCALLYQTTEIYDRWFILSMTPRPFLVFSPLFAAHTRSPKDLRLIGLGLLKPFDSFSLSPSTPFSISLFFLSLSLPRWHSALVSLFDLCQMILRFISNGRQEREKERG